MEATCLEIYSSLECPFAYLANYRLRQVLPEFSGRISLVWRALSLEFINQRGPHKPVIEAEFRLLQEIEPDLPWQPWRHPEWEYPSTLWPSFEALACAQAQGEEHAIVMSWLLRHAFFAESRPIHQRHTLLDLAAKAALQSGMNRARFISDWDSGRYKLVVLQESWRGWHALKLPGSPTFILASGKRITNPAVGDFDLDEETLALRSFNHPLENPLDTYRKLLAEACRSA